MTTSELPIRALPIKMLPIKVLHCITSLNPDGAQQMLLKVIANSDRERFIWKVVNLSDTEQIGKHLEEIGVEVVNLRLNRTQHIFSGLVAYSRLLREFKPHCIQGWMYHGNLFASAAYLLSMHAWNTPVAWNIRRGLDNFVADKLTTKVVIKLGALLSKLPNKIVYCAGVCRTEHEAAGFDKTRSLVIPNGFDSKRFQRDHDKRRLFREKLGVGEQELLVGIAGRYHDQKDFPTFLRAAAIVCRKMPQLRLVMAGRGVDSSNASLMELARSLEIGERLSMIGQCDDMVAFYSSLDVYCLSSITEGFPNVVGEAMSVGVPCVVTEAGGAGEIVEGHGEVVRRRNPEALATSIHKLLSLETSELLALGLKCRQRIESEFSIRSCALKYQQMYEGLCPHLVDREKESTSHRE